MEIVPRAPSMRETAGTPARSGRFEAGMETLGKQLTSGTTSGRWPREVDLRDSDAVFDPLPETPRLLEKRRRPRAVLVAAHLGELAKHRLLLGGKTGRGLDDKFDHHVAAFA